MVRALAANHSGVSIPFGAAHRVYFDTPPLKGCFRGTLVPRCELRQIPSVTRFPFLIRNRLQGWFCGGI
jgi:hypothetical protein